MSPLCPTTRCDSFIRCIDEISSDNQVEWSRPFIFISCSNFFRLRRDGEVRPIFESHRGIIRAAFQIITTQFIGQRAALPGSFYQMCGSLNAHGYKRKWEFDVVRAWDYESLHITIFTQADLPGCQMWLVYCPGFIELPICLIIFWYLSNLTENAFGKICFLDNGAPAYSTSYTCSLLFLPPGSSEYE